MRFRQAGRVSIADEREIVDYLLINGDHTFVSERIRQLIAEGWQPFGSVAYVMGHYAERFTQPMVKYAPDDIQAASPAEPPL